MTPAIEQVVSADGTSIGVWRAGTGPALVLVHGTTADHTRWAQVAPAFEKKFNVFTMDRRGRGKSGDAAIYSVVQEGLDIVAVCKRAGSSVNLLGHSYGALCCIDAAVRMPNLNKLVLYEPPVPMGRQIVSTEIQEELERLIERDEREAALVYFFREVVHVPESELNVMRGHPAWPGRLAAAHTLTRESRMEAEYQLDIDSLRSMAAPTLLLLGGESPDMFRAGTELLHSALPNSRIHEFSGQKHVAMDMIPDEFVRVVTDFLLS